jgi:hypothetical protein
LSVLDTCQVPEGEQIPFRTEMLGLRKFRGKKRESKNRSDKNRVEMYARED